MPDAILLVDSYGIVSTLTLLLAVSILLSFLDIAMVLTSWLLKLTFLLTVNDVVDTTRRQLIFDARLPENPGW